MSKWYKIIYTSGVETGAECLVENRSGICYERYVSNCNGKSWKVTGDIIFPYGYDTERFERYVKTASNVTIEEITEEEVFAIML